MVEEGDPNDVRAEGCGDGDGVVFGAAAGSPTLSLTTIS